MQKPNILITALFSIRNQFGVAEGAKKKQLLRDIDISKVNSKKGLFIYYEALLFLIAYPENKILSVLAQNALRIFEEYISSKEKLQYTLYNSGITKTAVCAAYSFEIVKWLRIHRSKDIRLISLEASDEQIRAVLTVVMQKIETEKMQESKAAWKDWLLNSLPKDEELLDGLIAIFSNSTLRPEVKGELWNTLGISTEIDFSSHCTIDDKIVPAYYHRSLIRKLDNKKIEIKPKRIILSESEAGQIIESSRMILIRQLREIDPISFTYPKGVTFYELPRGYSIALMNMEPERQVPNDCYIGYTIFKNGLPVAYAGSWILFDCSRIGLNVFPYYRGGEAQYIFQLVLQVHAKVYGLKRFTVDAYQIGKENYDGIRSGAFWVYYHAGFRPIENEQRLIAQEEANKIKLDPCYRSPASVLKKLAESRMELVLHKNAVRFDAVDLSDMYAAILKKQYKNNRMLAEKGKTKKLAAILGIRNVDEPAMTYVLKNWALILLYNEKELRSNPVFKKELSNLFTLKAMGKENEYIKAMQRATTFRKYLEKIGNEFLFLKKDQ